MIRISTTQLWVHDQDEALAFWRDKVGFEVRVRSPAGEETVTVLAADAASAALSAARLGEVLLLRRIGRVV